MAEENLATPTLNEIEWKVLYKYRSMEPMSVAFAKSIVVDSKLYFAAASSFNDPFDTLPSASVDCTIEELKTYYRILTDEFDPRRSDDEKAAFIRNMTSKSHAERLEIAREGLAEAATKATLCSLSARPDSVLMWSHYAANHTGICLRFLFPATWAHPVVYAEGRPVLNRIKTTLSAEKDMTGYGRALLTKADFWAYEEEWRALATNGPGERPFYPKSLCGIIFGARATTETRDLVASWIEERGIPLDLLDAVPDRDTFRINIVPQPGARYSG
jgi:hypothetical protein